MVVETESQKLKLSQKSSRDICWAARDDYFDCLTKENEDASKCTKEREAFDNTCSTVWVNHFISRREQQIRKERLERKFKELRGK